MRKVLLGVVGLLLAQNVFAVAAYDLLFQQRNSTNTAYINLIAASPTTTDGILYFNQSTHLALWLAPGNFTNVSGVLSAKPLSTDIPDSTVTGRGLLTAASATAARTAIGAGTPVTLTSQLTNDSSFVTTAGMTTALSGYPTNAAMTGALAGKMDTPTGSTSQFMRGDGSLATSKTALSEFTNDLLLGTAAYANVPASGNAASGEVVKGSDTRLTDSRTPTAHNQAWSTITSTPTTRVGYGITDAEPTITAGTTGQYWRGDKTWQTLDKTAVALGNVDNTSDANKPVSTAAAASIATKFTTPAGTTAQYVRGDGSLATMPTVAARSFNHATRAVNTCFQVSSTRDALVSYGVEIVTSISLSGGNNGTVYLRSYTNSSCSTGAQEITRVTNGQSGALTIGLNITQTVTLNITGVAPAGTWVQLVTENTTGSPTFTARPGQEVLL